MRHWRDATERMRPVAAVGADVLLALTLLCVGLAWLSAARSWHGEALVALQAVPLAFRRIAPRSVFLAVAAGAIAYGALGYRGSPIDIAEMVALYTIASGRPLGELLAAVGVALGGMVAVARTSPFWGGSTETVAFVLVVIIVALAGTHQRLRQARLVELAEHARSLQLAHAESNALAAAQERLHLAEELHDVVGHGLTVVLLHAGLARRALPDDPDRAAQAVTVIEERGRAVMGEMQRLLGVLHGEDETLTRAPRPCLAELDRLTSEVREAGIDVQLRREGKVSALPEGIEISAYRIVQEALTNTVRHSGAAHACVVLTYSPEALSIDISDDGRGVSGAGRSGGGRGLLGMRERVQRLGGHLELAGVPGAGFNVHAQLPLVENRYAAEDLCGRTS